MFEKHQHKKARDQQVQRGITTPIRRHEPDRDLRIFARILTNNVLIAMLFQNSESFVAVA